jgi:CubicO group peptidase (beta-lactamase class C family)
MPCRASIYSVVAPSLVLLLAVTTTAGADAPLPTTGWPVSTPAEQGLDAARLGELVELIREGERYPDIHSVLVVRHGYLVLEEYFAQSVTKSFTSAVMGIAIEQGILAGVEEQVLDFFPDHEGIENLDDRKRAMTIEDLLTMRSGNDYHERGPDSPHHQLNARSRGWTEFILNRPMINDPGTHFQYDSGGVILMSALIKARTGRHAHVLMRDELFEPLGIEDYRWYKNNEGHPHLGGGLMLRPRDMARFGLLYLRNGKWKGKQVVPAAWVQASLKRHVVFPAQADPFVGYGYLWWVLKPAEAGDGHSDIFAACGFRAQYIFVMPDQDMVVVVTGGTHNSVDQHKPLLFLYSHILPAVKDGQVDTAPSERRVP